MINSDDVEAFVHSDYACKDIMHGLAHIHRLKRLAQEIAEGRDYDPETLMLGAYFHGVIYRKEAEIRQFLESQGLSKEGVDRALQAAWESGTSAKPETIEGTILHDAHLLEGGKTFLIAKSLITGTARGQTLDETIRYFEENVLGRVRCYLPESQELYEEKEQLAREFLADLKANL
jgi:uncharacterized protein